MCKISIGKGKVEERNSEVNGEFGSVNTEGGNGSRGYGRCLVKSDFIYLFICLFVYLFLIKIP